MRLILICLTNNNRYLTLSITDTIKYQPLEIKFIKTNITLQFTMLYSDYLKNIDIFKILEVDDKTSIPHYDIYVENQTIKLFKLHGELDVSIGTLLKNTEIKYNRERLLNDLLTDEGRDSKLNYLLP